MMNVKVGPLIVRRSTQRHVHPARAVASAIGADFHLAYRVVIPEWPDVPTACQIGRARFEFARRHHLLPCGEVFHANLIQIHQARRLSETEMQSGGLGFILKRRELERNPLASRTDAKRSCTRCAPEHPRPHRFPINDQSRRPRRGIDLHRLHRGRKRAANQPQEQTQTATCLRHHGFLPR